MKKIYAVGIGPGDFNNMTNEAVNILKKSTCIAGYKLYISQIEEFTLGKKVISNSMLQEVDRCKMALDECLNGEIVSVISSGDSGIYGMAGLLMELCENEQYSEIEVIVIPGLTAAFSCASLIGAPFMNDGVLISLSDLMTPNATIRKRLSFIAQADMVVALYNPRSKKRHDLLEYAVEVFSAENKDLPFAIIKDGFRENQKIIIGKISEFPFEEVQMTTLVIFGNSATVVRNNQFYTRRGYKDKYNVC